MSEVYDRVYIRSFQSCQAKWGWKSLLKESLAIRFAVNGPIDFNKLKISIQQEYFCYDNVRRYIGIEM